MGSEHDAPLLQCAALRGAGRLAGLEKDELGKAVSMCYYLLAAIRIGNHL